MNIERLLCKVGIHLRGIRTAGCIYNISHCSICRKDVWHVWKELNVSKPPNVPGEARA